MDATVGWGVNKERKDFLRKDLDGKKMLCVCLVEQINSAEPTYSFEYSYFTRKRESGTSSSVDLRRRAASHGPVLEVETMSS